MTPPDWQHLVHWMTLRWPDVAKWKPGTIDAYYDDVRGYDSDDVMAAVRWHYRSGKRAPTGGQILSRMDEAGARPVIRDLGQCAHKWGIVNYYDDGRRDVLCSVCKEEKTVGSGQIATDAEMAYRAEAAQIAPM